MTGNNNSQSKAPWVIVSDFDGTFTVKDIGNELCEEVLGEKWFELYRQYRAGIFGLKEYQKKTWSNFPLSEKEFIDLSLKFAFLRPGLEEFLCQAVDQKIPVYVASCGLRPYIDATLKNKLSPKAQMAIKGIHCNEVKFDENKILEFVPPPSLPECPFPLDKGAWAKEVALKHGPQTQLLGIGNGTSDQSFWGAVHELAAIESLEKWCLKEKIPYISFENFFDLKKKVKAFHV